MCRMTKWRVKERAMEPTSHMFDQGGMATRDWFSESEFIALSISMVTSTDRAIVIGWGSVKILQSMPWNGEAPYNLTMFLQLILL